MSEVAGRLSIQAGIHFLEREHGGRGILLGGVPGVPRGKVCVIGAGTVGINAVRVAHALGAEVDVLDISLPRLTYLYDIFAGGIGTLVSNATNIERSIQESDLVIGAVLIPGARAPRLVTEAMVRRMRPGTVIVDVSVDQGGCIETIRPTITPIRVHPRGFHYGVPNCWRRSPDLRPPNTTLRARLAFPSRGPGRGAAHGINIHRGKVTCAGVARPWPPRRSRAPPFRHG
jgi:alanine dehydrogenase